MKKDFFNDKNLADSFENSATLEFTLPDCVILPASSGIDNVTYRNDSSAESEAASWLLFTFFNTTAFTIKSLL